MAAELLATLAKYPPYVSGHAHQAFWLNRALADLAGRPQHQVTSCGPVPAAYLDPRIIVHQVQAHPLANAKVPDGHLSKALAARLARLAVQDGVTAFLALYADPHASVALRAAQAAALAGRRPAVLVSLEGSDITSCLARHAMDGEAAVLLADVLAADAVMTVSHRAAELLLAAAEQALPAGVVAELAARLVVRPPGLPPESFAPAPAEQVAALRRLLRVPADARIVSTYVRLVPEKGVSRVLEVAAAAAAAGRSDLVFVLAGTGPMEQSIAAAAAGLPNARLLVGPTRAQAHALRCASALALLPSAVTADWEETFGIAAIEVQAVGVPVLASDSPAFAESVRDGRGRLSLDAPARAWLERVDGLLADPELGPDARVFAGGFTAERSARIVLDALAAVRATV
jgi:glycosyltransferase involved in cell wall biosynthesis